MLCRNMCRSRSRPRSSTSSHSWRSSSSRSLSQGSQPPPRRTTSPRMPAAPLHLPGDMTRLQRTTLTAARHNSPRPTSISRAAPQVCSNHLPISLAGTAYGCLAAQHLKGTKDRPQICKETLLMCGLVAMRNLPACRCNDIKSTSSLLHQGTLCKSVLQYVPELRVLYEVY